MLPAQSHIHCQQHQCKGVNQADAWQHVFSFMQLPTDDWAIVHGRNTQKLDMEAERRLRTPEEMAAEAAELRQAMASAHQ